MGNTLAYLIIVGLVVLCVVSIVIALLNRSNLVKCQTGEHPLCPSYFCAKTRAECKSSGEGGPPFRVTEKGQVQCQKHTLDPTVTNVKDADRINWTGT